MSPKPVISFRQRLLEDMAVRHFSEKSTHDYVRHIDRFLAFLGRPPETATADELRDFQVHLNQGGVRPASFNSAVSALRFFFCRGAVRGRARHGRCAWWWPAPRTHRGLRAGFPGGARGP